MLTNLFQQSLRDNSILAIWKQAYVILIYKKGNRSDPKNYSPVSLISLVCKTMEHILVGQIMKHLESNDILTEVQHGFRSKHSCEAQLFLTTNDLAKEIDNKAQVDMAILEFSKAFDKVRLKQKLEYYGIQGNLLGWFKSFLENYTQQIASGWWYLFFLFNYINRGSQGSVFGPVLFLLHINDITTNNSQLLYCLKLWPISYKRRVSISGLGIMIVCYNIITRIVYHFTCHQLPLEFIAGITDYKQLILLPIIIVCPV